MDGDKSDIMNGRTILKKAVLVFFFITFITHSHIVSQKPELVVQRGHSLYVSAIAYSPDGRLLASGGLGEIKLWDVASGKELRTMKTSSAVLSLLLTDNATLVAAGVSSYGGQTEILLYNIFTGKSIRTVPLEIRSQSAALSSSGEVAAFGCDDGSIKLYEVQTGNPIREIKLEFGTPSAIAISPFGSLIATGDDIGSLQLWNIASGKSVRKFEGHSNYTNAVAFSADGNFIASAGKDSTVRIWDVPGKHEGLLISDSNAVTCISFSGDNNFLARGTRDGMLRIWNRPGGRDVYSAKAHGSGAVVSSLAWSPEGTTLANGSYAEIKLWDIAGKRELAKLGGSSGSVASVAFSPNGEILAASDYLGKIAFWDLNLGRIKNVIKKPNAFIRPVHFSPDGKLLLSGDQFEPSVTLWYHGIEKDIMTLRGHSDDLTDVKISPDGYVIATASRDSTIMLWDAVSFELLSILTGPAREINCLAFSPDGQWLVSGGEDANLIIWDVKSGKEKKQLKGHTGPIRSVNFSLDNQSIISTSGDSTLKFWTIETGLQVRSIKQPSRITASSLNSEGSTLATANESVVKLWDVTTGKELRRLNGDADDDFSSLDFSPNGKWVAAGSYNSNVKLWNTSTGKLAAMMTLIDSSDWVVISPDGTFDGTPDGMKRIHYVQGVTPIPLDAFFEEFYSPNLLQSIIAGKYKPRRKHGIDLTRAINLPPKIKIVSPKNNFTASSETQEMTLEATDQGGGIDEVRLYHNDKLIGDEQIVSKKTSNVGKKITVTYSVPLLAGTNTLRATAFNSDRTESNPQEIKILYTAAEANANLYLLVVGINEYKNGKYTLNYARPDAHAFAHQVDFFGKSIFKQIITQEIYDTSATRRNMESAFQKIVKEAKPADCFVFYYAGHGVMSEGDSIHPSEFYFIPHDIVQLYGNDETLLTKAFPAKKLREYSTRIKATKQLVVMDACQAGGAVEAFSTRGAAEEKAILQLARSAGLVVMSATGTEQFAAEFSQLGHGVFTYALLKGLSGEADSGTNPDRKITVKELEAYVNDKVPELTKKYRGSAQYPNSYARGQDFPLGVVR